MKHKAILYCVGVPLHEDRPLFPSSIEAISGADLIIGESFKVLSRFIKSTELTAGTPKFALDNQKAPDREDMQKKLRELASKGGKAVLFSDTGMPILFDPGAEVLEFCRKLGFEIRSSEGATSWGSACALSGFPPPFWVEGFLPREPEERQRRLLELKKIPAHLVIMETPYRFNALLKALLPDFRKRAAFLAWEIASAQEKLMWGTLGEIESQAKKLGLDKGEFVLILSALRYNE